LFLIVILKTLIFHKVV